MKIKKSSRQPTLFFSFLIVFIIGTILLLFLYKNGKPIVELKEGVPVSEKEFKAGLKPITFPQMLSKYADKTILLMVRDDAAESLSDTIRNFVAQMGGMELSRLQRIAAYAGVVENGKFIAEKSDDKKVVELTHQGFRLSSTGRKMSDHSSLRFPNDQYVQARLRGLFAYVLEKGRIAFYHHFDLSAKDNPTSTRKYLNANFDFVKKVRLRISKPDYFKLKKKRDEAVESGILITGDDDFIPADIFYDEKEYQGEIRLKGDWVDHLLHDQWSFRVVLDNEQTLEGMGVFSLHRPRTRGHVGEWLYHQVMKDNGILSLKYDFVQVSLEVEGEEDIDINNLGIYAYEQFAEKQVIEHNARRAGLLMKFDDKALWHRRNYEREIELPWFDNSLGFQDNKDFVIVPFSRKAVLRDSTLRKQFLMGRHLLVNYLSGQLPIEQVFNVPLYAKYTVISNLLGGQHSLYVENNRFYYNPIDMNLEPLSFDGNTGATIKKVKFVLPEDYSNPVFRQALKKNFEQLSTPQQLSHFKNYPGLWERIHLLQSTDIYYYWSDSFLQKNKAVMQKHFSNASINNSVQ